MSQIEFGGQGGPIPNLALPDPNLSSDVPSQQLVLEDGVPFEKGNWIGLGYTHYEVSCIGGAGGYGGGVRRALGYKQYSFSKGGGGGGGGLHRVSGLLSDLPESCPVVIGQAGEKGIDGNGAQRELVRVDADGLAYVPYQYYPNPEFREPQPGQDGGTSSFNGDTCQASGGKGGGASPITRPVEATWIGGTGEYYSDTLPGGNGGQGGSGGRILAGGGAEGAKTKYTWLPPLPQPPGYPIGPPRLDTVSLISAADGGWDGVIGKGGGGGRGGNYISKGGLMYSAPAMIPIFFLILLTGFPLGFPMAVAELGMFLESLISSTPGGRGSFSYTDTSVYGARGSQSNEVIWTVDLSSGKMVIPGTGGGARLNKLSGFGSYATGFNPNGVVAIRLMKIE